MANTLLVVGVKPDSYTYELLTKHNKFSVSVLESGQKDLAFAFFKHVAPENGKFGDHAYHTETTGAPVLDAAPAWWECNVTQLVQGGDHVIVVGQVVEAGVQKEGAKPLSKAEVGVTAAGNAVAPRREAGVMKPFRVALCQARAYDIGDAEANLTGLLALLDEAGRQGARLVLLPECAYPAYYLGDADPYTHPGVRPYDEVVALFAAKAKAYGYWLVAGMAVPHGPAG